MRMRSILLVTVCTVVLGCQAKSAVPTCGEREVAEAIIVAERPGMGELERAFWLEAISRSARSHSIPFIVSVSKIAQESKFGLYILSDKGARGPAQLMPRWPASDFKDCKGINPFDIEPALNCGNSVLADELKFAKGDIKLALQFYNGGRQSANNSDTKTYANEVLSRAYVAGLKCKPTT